MAVSAIKGCGHALVPLVIGKDHGQLLIKSALHSFFSQIIVRFQWIDSELTLPIYNKYRIHSFTLFSCACDTDKKRS